MKSLAFYSVLAIVLGCGVSAMAADPPASEFYAVSQLEGSADLNVMPDSELTKVEGMGHDNLCSCRGYSSSYTNIYQSNSMGQANLNVGGKRGGDVSQGNFALQSNFVIVR
jgi:hypothetical protein